MKKNYFLHTAILLVALVCGSVPVWGARLTKKYLLSKNLPMENM